VRISIAISGVAACLLAGPNIVAAAGVCVAPEALLRLDAPLAHATERLAAKQPLTIVAIGSSSTAGVGASSPGTTYPSRLAVELSARLPEAKLRVLNRGVGGETEPQMEARFERDVVAEHPDLVIWQVGTNSLLRNEDISRYESALERGIERLKAIGADVIIMNPQYAPKVVAHAQYEDMLGKIAAATRHENVPLFQRFAIMEHWSKSGAADISSMLSPDQLHMNDWSYGCLAILLSSAIVEATRAPPSSHTAKAGPTGTAPPSAPAARASPATK
jgi:lysophospholipase L1-like esterase